MKRVILLLLIWPWFAACAEPPNYLDVIPEFWRNLYPDGGQGLYCEERFEAGDRGFNIEHVYPMSWVTKALGCGDRDRCRRVSPQFNQIESDMHNLYPARKDVNHSRGSYAFREVSGGTRIAAACATRVDHRARVVDPAPASRGNIARAMLYMADTYPLEIYRRQREMLLRWHAEDPVDAEERRRNAVIGKIQGRSNHWIR